MTAPSIQMKLNVQLPPDSHGREGHFGSETGTDGILDINNLCEHQISTSPPAQMAMEGGGNESANGFS